ncbi:MAG: Asp-tRNA(Asn)/Glu-tRNA(Gln) amidotransferase subunit GatB [Candidatus Omnitrophota bacterium]|nr:Asp-tRNA(Asn)/Glu-tRNA(Gln) amidotransferase subunit GatB [Candidatus Omnitrophota bacterium]
MNYEAVIGLEVHLHLKAKTKAFCGCATEFGNEPNSQTCPVCLGFPGSLPVLNKQALELAIKVALALNCKVREYTKFDRKNYFYPDLPKNFQISQYTQALSHNGYLDINLEGKTKRIGILRVHMEEDAGKLIHKEVLSLIDFNRAGVPLLEIVTKPDINSPQEAHEYLAALKNILEYLEVSDCDMEKGSLRCDANISLRQTGTKTLGVKTELKNMNSFKGVRDALAYEIKRQSELLGKGERLTQETRLWDSKESLTLLMRTKEKAQDYRYFPEPDLPPFIISKDKIEEVRRQISELPRGKIARFMKEYSLSEYEAKILAASRQDADYAEECIKKYPAKDKKTIVNWLIGPVLSEANSRNCTLSELKIPGGNTELISLAKLTAEGKISHLAAKAVFSESITTARLASEIIRKNNLYQISDNASLEATADEVIKENPKSAGDYKAGKENALMFLVGQAMKKSGGKANPKVMQEILKGRLS